MSTLYESLTLPLIKGDGTSPSTALKVETTLGMLMVAGEPETRDGLIFQRCLCGCNRNSCIGEADFDVRFLNNPNNFATGACHLQGKRFFPAFEVLRDAVRSAGICNTSQYRKAYSRRLLPKGSPSDPTEYEVWTSWADFTGVDEYHSERELFDGLLALDLDKLGLLPRPDRRRVLVFSKYWASIKRKAAELKIDEKDIPDRLADIVACLRPDRSAYEEAAGAGSSSRGGGGGGRGTGSGTRTPAPLSLSEQSAVLVDSVTIWLPFGPEIQREMINGFFANVWETLDREDTLRGNGYEAVSEHILRPLLGLKPDLVAEFEEQYRGVLKYRNGQRNWMQAYNLWYSESHTRYINWSSAGLGKTRTVPALSSIHDIRLTVLFSPKAITNEHNPQIPEELNIEDPLAVIHYSDYGVPKEFERGKHHYFVANPEKLQLGQKTIEMIDALMKHRPGLFVFDEAHLLVSTNLVDPETGDTKKDANYKPRMTGLRYLLDQLETDQRVVLLTGTPVRVDAREGQALFELIGEDIGEMTKEMSELNALRLRGRLQEFGFLFLNHRLPEFRSYIYPFLVSDELATELNMKGGSLAEKEAKRIEAALQHVSQLKGKVVINTERIAFLEEEAVSVTAFDKEQLSAGAEPLLGSRFPLVRLHYEPMERAVNPVYFSHFVMGPTEVIGRHLRECGAPYRLCTGESERDELGEYLKKRDSCLIASSAWSTGVDGSQKVSNTIVTLGVPWHDSGHRQMVARIHRQGACTPDGTPSTVIHEIIPVALNVDYDVRRLNKVYSRRSFGEVLRLGDVGADDEEVEFAQAVQVIHDLQEQQALPLS
jgi:hypothetical protein